MQVSGKPGKNPKFQLGGSESKLGSEIQETTNIPCVCNEFVGELVRGLRLHISRFLKGLEEHDMTRSQLGLAHSYSRAKVAARPVPPAHNRHSICKATVDLDENDLNWTQNPPQLSIW